MKVGIKKPLIQRISGMFTYSSAHLQASASGFSTLILDQVAGRHRASPSVSLDKLLLNLLILILQT